MITGIVYDNDEPSTATTSVTSTTITAATVSSAVPVTVMDSSVTTTTSVPIPVTMTAEISYVTSIPNHHNVVMHNNPKVNDRLLMFRKLTWIQCVKVQMYEEN
jgi:hypothetical protein